MPKKSMKVGGGGRFEKLSDKIQAEGNSKEQADAIAAAIGRKKYGKAGMAKMAAAGKKKKG